MKHQILGTIIFSLFYFAQAQQTKPPAVSQCYSGVQIDYSNGTNIFKIGASIYAPGGTSCIKINGPLTSNNSSKSSNYSATIYGAETYGFCDDTKFNITIGEHGINYFCCKDNNNCNNEYNGTNTGGKNENYLACYEGVWFNGTELSKNKDPGYCYNGYCAALFGNIAGYDLEIYTCLATSVTKAFKLDNQCGEITIKNGLKTTKTGLSGCACNTSNSCIDGDVVGKLPNVTTPAPPPTTAKYKASQCFSGVHVTYPNGTDMFKIGQSIQVVSGSSCVRAYGVLDSNNTGYIYGTDTYGVCEQVSNLQENGINFHCCSDSNNCNNDNNNGGVNSGGMEDITVCYESLYMNGSLVSKNKDPSICYGYCGMITGNLSGFPMEIYTCIGIDVAKKLSLDNKCGDTGTGLSGCACNTDRCIDDATGVNPGNSKTDPQYFGSSDSTVSGATNAPTTPPPSSGNALTTSFVIFFGALIFSLFKF